MRAKLVFFAFLTLSAITLLGQESNRPRISNITVLPSEPVSSSGNCTASRSGYLEKNGRTKMTQAEVGKFVNSGLHEGYVLTNYPESKRGLFVNLECTNSTASATP